ncbi:MAG: zinc-finger domain-containing protein [Pseudomonadota bacterium]|nr:zinc-finger domain-containing protein [Pseudomonadota bacterium]
MSDHGTPRFHNDSGVAAIHIGVKEFKCLGATPPFDHPHVYLDMGAASEIICPYCATVFRYDPALARHDSRPPEATYRGD